MVVGICDLDLFGKERSYPILEVMQINNYLQQQGHKVYMFSTKDSDKRFDKVMYFKEIPKTKIPMGVEIAGEKRSHYGYGFYKVPIQLKPEYYTVPPAYDIYNKYFDKFAINYEIFNKSSYVRVANENFIDFDDNKLRIIIADNDFLYVPSATQYIKDHFAKHNFYFAHPIIARDEETVAKFEPYIDNFQRKITIKFDYSEDFFYEYCGSVYFSYDRREGEREENYLIRIAKMGLWCKAKNRIGFYYNHSVPGTFDYYIKEWINKGTQLSFYEFYKNNTDVLKSLNSCNSELRLLLKTAPPTVSKGDLDLKSNLH